MSALAPFSITLTFGLISSILILVLMLISPEPPLVLVVAQLLFFVLAIVVCFLVGLVYEYAHDECEQQGA